MSAVRQLQKKARPGSRAFCQLISGDFFRVVAGGAVLRPAVVFVAEFADLVTIHFGDAAESAQSAVTEIAILAERFGMRAVREGDLSAGRVVGGGEFGIAKIITGAGDRDDKKGSREKDNNSVHLFPGS